jgi:acyl-homoserine lactone acylase PvdQ
VNKFVAQHAEARALPGEVALSGRRPLPWTEEDSLAIAARQVAGGSRCAVANRNVAAKGHGILAADLAFDGPAPGFYEVGLDAPGLRAIGVSIPGVPGLVAGHNGWVSWAVLGGVGSNASSALDALLEWMWARRLGDAFVRPLQTGVFSACAVDVHGAAAQGVFPGLPERHVRLEDVRRAFGAPRVPVGARILIDLAEVDTSRSAVSHGASGHRASPHFGDQAPLWKIGQTHRLPFSRGAVGRTDGELVFRAR